jgi:hypothetical protein
MGNHVMCLTWSASPPLYLRELGNLLVIVPFEADDVDKARGLLVTYPKYPALKRVIERMRPILCAVISTAPVINCTKRRLC